MDIRIKELEPLLKIKKVKDVKSFRIISTWVDDDLQCAEVEINGISIKILYYDEIGFLKYWRESKTAFKELKDAIQTFYNWKIWHKILFLEC